MQCICGKDPITCSSCGFVVKPVCDICGSPNYMQIGIWTEKLECQDLPCMYQRALRRAQEARDKTRKLSLIRSA